mmetsp:Transcript_88548/g.255373  ORF Transcript_88548/g.255373 Transcript_88548/m.255373 type:complete len:374 (-) Transcript_88548:3001-4122(-)
MPALLVLGDQLFEVVGVPDDVHACDLRTLELLRLDARQVDLLPRKGVVRLLRRIDSLSVLAKHHVRRRQLGIVVDRLVKDLRGFEGLFIIQAVSHGLDVRGVRAGDKFLHGPQGFGLGVRVHELGVDDLVLRGLPGHQQIPDEVVEQLLALGGLDDLVVICGVLGLEVRVDGLGNLAILELRLAQLVPDVIVAAARRELLRPLDGLDVREQHLHGLGVEVLLLVDEEGLLVQPVGLAHCDLGDLRAVVVVQAVDVVHDAGLVGLDRRQNEQVLQVPVLAEVGRLVQHDLFEQLDELVGHVGGDEGLHRGGHLLRVRGLGQRGAHHLVNDVAAVLVLWVEDQGPELRALALHQVPRLQAEKAVAVRDADELLVA